MQTPTPKYNGNSFINRGDEMRTDGWTEWLPLYVLTSYYLCKESTRIDYKNNPLRYHFRVRQNFPVLHVLVHSFHNTAFIKGSVIYSMAFCKSAFLCPVICRSSSSFTSSLMIRCGLRCFKITVILTTSRWVKADKDIRNGVLVINEHHQQII